jgi:hypothetical protein
MEAVRWFPIVLPSHSPTDTDLAAVHAQKTKERRDTLHEIIICEIELRDYLYDLYVKKTHENCIRMEIYSISTIDIYV